VILLSIKKDQKTLDQAYSVAGFSASPFGWLKQSRSILLFASKKTSAFSETLLSEVLF